jgi:Fe-S cluster biogenesis protein NfuA
VSLPDVAAIERALAEVRPHLHGDVELVGVEAGDVVVRFSGRCADCTMQALTLRTGVETVLRSRVPGIRSVVAVEEEAARA